MSKHQTRHKSAAQRRALVEREEEERASREALRHLSGPVETTDQSSTPERASATGPGNHQTPSATGPDERRTTVTEFDMTPPDLDLPHLVEKLIQGDGPNGRLPTGPWTLKRWSREVIDGDEILAVAWLMRPTFDCVPYFSVTVSRNGIPLPQSAALSLAPWIAPVQRVNCAAYNGRPILAESRALAFIEAGDIESLATFWRISVTTADTIARIVKRDDLTAGPDNAVSYYALSLKQTWREDAEVALDVILDGTEYVVPLRRP